jgi:hypothetical protein
MSSANTERQSLWVVYDFEQDMFRHTLHVATTDECRQFPQPIQNAIVESMLLHLRILVNILLSRGSGDDINLTGLLPSFTSPRIDQLRNAYGNRNKVDSPCWHLNKRLAHPTRVRSSSYNYDHVLNALLPFLVPLLDQIAAARQESP